MLTAFYERPFPEIDIDDDYYLREQSVEDTQDFFEYYGSDPEVFKHILATPPTTLAEASSELHYCRNLFYEKTGIYWSLVSKKDKKMIGAVGLYINNQHHRAEICYDLHQKYWRQGIMSRAIKAITDYAFQHMDIYRVEAVTLKENVPSIEILKKLGYVYEGTLYSYRYFKGEPRDVECLAITSNSWKNC